MPQPDARDPVPPEVIGHYEAFNEGDRLGSGIGMLERDRTRMLLERWLPDAPAVVLDVGGGAGVHALWLAARGYAVHLSDPVPHHVDQAHAVAHAQNVELASATVGDASTLDHGDASADAVMLMGPLYHLQDQADRNRALREAHRVLRPGGVVVAAAISRFVSMINALREALRPDNPFTGIVDQDLATGRHDNVTGHPDHFTTAFFHHPDELRGEIEAAGFGASEVVAVEGVGWLLPDFERHWRDDAMRRHVLDLIERTEAEASLLGASTHFLARALKPGPAPE